MSHLLRIALPLTGLLLVFTAVMQLGSHDDSELRYLLLPPDCPQPCVMGIVPGVTTRSAAISRIQQHEWVDPATLIQSEWRVEWSWHQDAPAFIRTAPIGSIFFERGVVSRVVLRLDANLGQVLLTRDGRRTTRYGRTAINRSNMTRVELVSAHLFMDNVVVASSWITSCPDHYRRLYESPATVYWFASAPSSDQFNRLLLSPGWRCTTT